MSITYAYTKTSKQTNKISNSSLERLNNDLNFSIQNLNVQQEIKPKLT